MVTFLLRKDARNGNHGILIKIETDGNNNLLTINIKITTVKARGNNRDKNIGDNGKHLGWYKNNDHPKHLGSDGSDLINPEIFEVTNYTNDVSLENEEVSDCYEYGIRVSFLEKNGTVSNYMMQGRRFTPMMNGNGVYIMPFNPSGLPSIVPYSSVSPIVGY